MNSFRLVVCCSKAEKGTLPLENWSATNLRREKPAGNQTFRQKIVCNFGRRSREKEHFFTIIVITIRLLVIESLTW